MSGATGEWPILGSDVDALAAGIIVQTAGAEYLLFIKDHCPYHPFHKKPQLC